MTIDLALLLKTLMVWSDLKKVYVGTLPPLVSMTLLTQEIKLSIRKRNILREIEANANQNLSTVYWTSVRANTQSQDHLSLLKMFVVYPVNLSSTLRHRFILLPDSDALVRTGIPWCPAVHFTQALRGGGTHSLEEAWTKLHCVVPHLVYRLLLVKNVVITWRCTVRGSA